MAKSFGAWMKEKRPDLYGQASEEDLNATVRERLATTEGRARLVSKIRENIQLRPATTDDDILRNAAENLGAAQAMDMGEVNQRIMHANQREQTANTYMDARQAAGELKAAKAQGQPTSSHTDELVSAADNLTSPGSPLEVPLVGRAGPSADGPGLMDLMRQNPGSKIKGDWMQKVLVDKNGKAIAALRPGASIPGYEKETTWEKVDPLNRVTGNLSHVQTGMAQGLRGVASAVAGRDVSPGESKSLSNTGYGLPEAGSDIGAAAGAAAPELGTVLGQMVARNTGRVMQGYSRVDRAEADALDWMARKLRSMGAEQAAASFDKWSKDNTAEAQKYSQLAKDSADAANWDVPEYAKKGFAEEFGREFGHTGGEVASIAAPSDIILPGAVTKGIGAATRAVAPKTAAAAAAKYATATAPVRAAAQHVREAAVEFMPDTVGFFVNRPFAMAHSGKARDVLDVGAGASKNTAVMAGESMTRDMLDAEAALRSKMGWSEKEFAKHAQGAKDKWTSRALREQATPEEAALIDLWQPYHRRVFDSSGLKGQYNPFHDIYGQDPSRPARILQTTEARKDVQELGNVPWGATPHDVASPGLRNVPGLRTMGNDAYLSSRIYDVKPRAEKAEMIGQRIIDNGTPSALPGINTKAGNWLLTRSKRAEAERAVKNVKENLPATAFGQSLTRELSHVSAAQTNAAAAMGAELPTLAGMDKRFTTFGDLLKSQSYQKNAADLANPNARVYERNALGRTRISRPRSGPGGGPIPVEGLALEKTLRDEGQVVINVKGQPPLHNFHLEAGEGLGGGRSVTQVNLPETFGPEWHGAVVPRTFAKAAMESVTFGNAPRGAATKQFIQDLDKLLGMNQQKRLITVGNMGFDQRNRINEVFRVVAEEGSGAVDRSLLRKVAQVSNAPIGRASGESITFDGVRWFDTGLLHTDLRRMGLMRSGITEDAARKAMSEAGSGQLAHAVPGLGSGIDALNSAALKPGEASSAVADSFARQLFDYEWKGSATKGRGLSKHYRGEDGIRMWAAMAKMKRGQTLESAARDAKSLLIDYTDKSTAETVAGFAIPFAKYYTGMIGGAVRIAAKNPRAYSRAADFARVVENYDRAVEGYGSFDPRDKNLMENIGMFPVVKMGQSRASIRSEHIPGEVASLADTIWGDDVGFGRNLHPFIGGAYAATTGKDIGSGRSLYGLSAKEQLGADQGVYDQWSQAADEDKWLGKGMKLGSHPVGQLTWAMLKHAPFLGGRVMTPQMETVARVGMGLGSGPSSRTVQGSADTLRRSAMSSVTGVRMPPSDPLQERANQARKVADKMPPLLLEQMAQRRMRGRPVEGSR